VQNQPLKKLPNGGQKNVMATRCAWTGGKKAIQHLWRNIAQLGDALRDKIAIEQYKKLFLPIIA
jgi:hypothetical protein